MVKLIHLIDRGVERAVQQYLRHFVTRDLMSFSGGRQGRRERGGKTVMWGNEAGMGSGE